MPRGRNRSTFALQSFEPPQRLLERRLAVLAGEDAELRRGYLPQGRHRVIPPIRALIVKRSDQADHPVGIFQEVFGELALDLTVPGCIAIPRFRSRQRVETLSVIGGDHATGGVGDLLRLREHVGPVAAVDQALSNLAGVLGERSLSHAVTDQDEIDGCLRRRQRGDPAGLAATDEADPRDAMARKPSRLVERRRRVRRGTSVSVARPNSIVVWLHPPSRATAVGGPSSVQPRVAVQRPSVCRVRRPDSPDSSRYRRPSSEGVKVSSRPLASR